MTSTARILTCLMITAAFGISCARDSAQKIASAETDLPATNQVPLTAPTEIAGRYRREPFDYASHPYLTAVGKISFLGGTWCSMTLLADRIGVTAGHCFRKTNVKFDLNRPLGEYSAPVIFKPKGAAPVRGNYVRRVLKITENPDYAIVELAKPVSESLIRPMRVRIFGLEDFRREQETLGCAGYNGDAEMGSGGLLMTVSRGIAIVEGQNSEHRVDTTCFATYGGSGGPLFRQTPDGLGEFLGVVWGVTDEEYDEAGNLVKTENIVTSVTPARVFVGDLKRLGIVAEQ